MKANFTNTTKILGMSLVILVIVFVMAKMAPVKLAFAQSQSCLQVAVSSGACGAGDQDCVLDFCFLRWQGFFDRNLQNNTNNNTNNTVTDSTNNPNPGCFPGSSSSSSGVPCPGSSSSSSKPFQNGD